MSTPAMSLRPSDESGPKLPANIPAVALTGSPSDKLRTIDASIARLQRLRTLLVGEASPEPPIELRGRYLNAPVWPWFAAGWIVGALFVLMFVLARALA